MAVPKWRTSRSKSRSRKANWKGILPNIARCRNCNKDKIPYMICRSCGFYANKQILKVD